MTYKSLQLMLLIKKSYNLIRPETKLVTPNQKWQFQVLSSLDDSLPEKKIKYQLILFTEIDDERILLSDWMRNKHGNNQTKVVFSDATFPK